MTAWVVSGLASLALSALAGWLLPSWAMNRLMPTLESRGKRVINYRGASVPMGLGIVWLIWVAGVTMLGTVLSGGIFRLLTAGRPHDAPWFATVVAMPFLQITSVLPLLLVAGAAAFGLVDDHFGDASARGFGGHMRALAGGRLTTGGLKMFGIGALALAAALPLTQAAVGSGGSGSPGVLGAVAIWGCAALVIALSANLVNLTDVRPGRALKMYSFLVIVATIIVLWPSTTASLAFFVGGASSGAIDLVATGIMKLSLLTLALGPVLAVWRFDLGERAMLGDAGANAAGALAGFLLAWRSPLWLLAVLAVVLLALNVTSERVSFSKVIERVAFLRWLDGLGRIASDAPGVEVDVMEDDE